MSKYLTIIVALALSLSFVFGNCVTAYAYDIDDISSYYRNYYLSKENLRKKPAELIIGDVNYDGAINATDALFALSYAIGGTETYSPYSWWEIAWGGYLTNSLYSQYYDLTACYPESTDTEYNIGFYYLICNSFIMADVSGDNDFSAEDALLILQYAVGKRTDFPRTDVHGDGKNFCLVLWPDECTHDILYGYLRERFY